MILEAIVTTINEDGSTNISPMGPTVTEDLSQFVLRPFDTSTTFANLKRTKSGVMHVTDDVLMFARSAIGDKPTEVRTKDADKVEGKILLDACRYYEFRVEFIDETGARMSLNCQTVGSGRLRDFWGFNRAKHAVIEAAILATRLDFLPGREVEESLSRLQTIVEKTAGPKETEAMKLISDYVRCRYTDLENENSQ